MSTMVECSVFYDAKKREGRTFSFHSKTHFSIQGTKLITTNSLINLPICEISSWVILSISNGAAPGVGVTGRVSGSCVCVCGGSRGFSAGTEMGGGAGKGRDRRRRYMWSPYCFFAALKRAIAL
jgi:hypothetical protein